MTKNGRGCYAIIDIQDYEKTQATIRLMNELEKGRNSGEEKGWQTLAVVSRITLLAAARKQKSDNRVPLLIWSQ